LEIPLDESDIRSKGPAATCFKTNSVVIIEDIEKDPRMIPWKEEALKRGFRSSATLPVRKNGDIIGVFGMYADEINFFQEEERSLLEELALDIEMALNAIKTHWLFQAVESGLSSYMDLFIMTDNDGNILYVGDKTLKVFGYDKSELLGKKVDVLFNYKDLLEAISQSKEYSGIVIFRTKQNNNVYVDLIAIPVANDNFILVGKDISREKNLEEQMHFLLSQDSVTGLFSNSFLMTELDMHVKRAVEISKRRNELSTAGSDGNETNAGKTGYNRIWAFILADIYKFTYINDVYGFGVGNELLKAVGRRLRDIFRPTDIIGRVSSDTFGIILTDLRDKEDVILLLDKLRKAFEQPFNINGNIISVAMQMGITIFPDNGTSAEEVYKNADISLAKAKKNTEWSYVFFSDDLNSKASQFLLYKTLLEKAFEKEEFVIYYQPYFDINTLCIAGFEALTRWRSEELGFIPPMHFIPILEESGLISKLETWLINQACKDLKRIHSTKLSANVPMPVSINISPISFKNEDVYEKIVNVISRYKNADLLGYINIEITESLFLENFDKALSTLENLRNSGFKISIDDFGTGYSSFSYLKDLPIDYLKIDISFVRHILNDKKSRSITKTIIELAHNLEMKTIAEGVETKEQFELLKSLGCDFIQGFWLAKPMPISELVDFIESWEHKKLNYY
jgi:PAS domain S-box/diguanylate cyclase (GGDEF) domain